jgi:hypothetical protein
MVNLYAHLVGVHKQSAEQIKVYITPRAPVLQPRKESACPLGAECDMEFIVKTNNEVRSHLKREHQFSEEDPLDMVPRKRTKLMSEV